MSFFNLQTHPLLEESQFADGVEIIENYIAVFGDIWFYLFFFKIHLYLLKLKIIQKKTLFKKST